MQALAHAAKTGMLEGRVYGRLGELPSEAICI